MTLQVFALPDLGEGLTEAEVVRWLIAVGDEVAVDQPVVEVETAKSIVEVPSPYAGRVRQLHGAAGDVVAVGQPLIAIAAEAAPETTQSAAEHHREEEMAGSGNVLIGYGTAAGSGARRQRRPRRPVPVVPAEPRVPGVPRVSSPLVRKRARELGVRIQELVGSGPDGMITRRDVEAATATATDSVPVRVRPGLPPAHRIPLSGFRQAVAATLSRSRREIPEATVWVDVDFTELFALRENAKAAGRRPPSLLAYLARFTIAGLRAHPELNGEVDSERGELVQYDGVNLGLAVQTDRGLVVPAVRNADRLTTAELDREIRRLTAAAREGRASGSEPAAGTFTLNNYGAFGVDGSAAIINHPQVAILGFGRVIDRPWVVAGELAIRKLALMSFVFDHRVCDGGTAAGFMRLVADAVENPASAIANL